MEVSCSVYSKKNSEDKTFKTYNNVKILHKQQINTIRNEREKLV